MTLPSKVYIATVSSGIFYTENFNNTGVQPIWSSVNSGLPEITIRQFGYDPFDPIGRQYALVETARTLYTRVNGGNWEALITPADCDTLTGKAGGTIWWFTADKSVAGRLWVQYLNNVDSSKVWAIYSDDYGVTWHAATKIRESDINPTDTMYGIQSYGDTVFAHFSRRDAIIVAYSNDKGGSWTQASAGWFGKINLNPLQPTFVYYSDDGIGHGMRKLSNAGVVTDLAGPGFVTQTNMWFSATDANHHREITGSKVYVTTDSWVNVNSPSTITPQPYAIAPYAGDDEDDIVVAVALHLTHDGEYQPHCIGCLYGEADTTPVLVAGANCGTSPYTDSIPETCGGVTVNGFLILPPAPAYSSPVPDPDDTITPPGGSPITLGGTANTQAVTMPGYTGSQRGEPLPGDRGAWAVDTEAHAKLHASDIADSAPVYHNPTGATTGDAPIWDGSKWTPADVLTPAEHTAIGNGAPHHAPVTLGAGSDAALTLTGQELKLTLPALANHDHSGDAGDGGTFDAANLTSGAATDGQVLTADGSGGAAWENAIGGGKYRTYVYAINNGDFNFIRDTEGYPITSLEELE